MRDIRAAIERGDAAAMLAFEVYVHRLRAYAGAYLAQLGGVDVISFTAGVGENAPARARRRRSRRWASPGSRSTRSATRRRGAASGSSRRMPRRVTVLVVPTERGARDRPADAAASPTALTGTALDRAALRLHDGATRSRPSIRTSPGGSRGHDALPDLTAYDAVLFDLDGVLTPTAEVHMHAWQTMFEELFAAWDIAPPYTERDYFDYLDGKKRYDGVASLLRSRDVEVPWGDPSDPLEADTVCGIGNRKNVVFERVLRARGHRAVPGLARAARRARRGRHPGRGRVELEERRRGARGRRASATASPSSWTA